jgi:hypothetical protein
MNLLKKLARWVGRGTAVTATRDRASSTPCPALFSAIDAVRPMIPLDLIAQLRRPETPR